MVERLEAGRVAAAAGRLRVAVCARTLASTVRIRLSIEALRRLKPGDSAPQTEVLVEGALVRADHGAPVHCCFSTSIRCDQCVVRD